MKIAALILALMSAASGFWAAYRWYRASDVYVVVFDEGDGDPPTPDLEARLTAQAITLQEVARLNKHAAIATAISVVLGGLSVVADALAT
jgi:hypothetical protein